MPQTPFSNSIINRAEDAQALQTYLDDRCLEPADFPDGLTIFRDQDLLRTRRYAVKLAAGRPYFMLRYLDARGQPYLKKNDPYELARFLGAPLLWRDKEPPPKVLAQMGRGNVLHFEPIPADEEGAERDWFHLPDGQVVVHLESMVKAKAVSKWLKLPCVGLNGVNSYSSSKTGVELIYSDTGVDFSRFVNVILFDSNTHKKEVKQARHNLAFKLRNVLGCKDVRLATLPRPNNTSDWGPDDFLHAHGNEALRTVVDAAEEYVGSLDDGIIDAIQGRCIYCSQIGAFIDRDDKVVRDRSKVEMLYRPIHRKEIKRGQERTIYGFPLWLDTHTRATVEAPCYRYLGEEFVEKEDGVYYNLFRGAGADPLQMRTQAGAAIVTQLVNMLGEENTELFRSYMRYLRFNPGKPCTLLVLHGTQRGQGKGWAAKLAGRLIGMRNVAHARGKDMSSNFNAILQAKRLIVFNEYTPDGSRMTALNSIKGLAGDEFITIEPKGVDPYSIENGAGAIFTTNFLDDVPTDGLEDRRLIYMEAENRAVVSDAEWVQLHAMVDDMEAMADFATWVLEGNAIDMAVWRPDPRDPVRQEAIMESGARGVNGMLRWMLHDLQESESQLVCVRADAIMVKLGDTAKDFTVRSLAAQLPHADWRSSKKKYGARGELAKVWILDAKKFALIEEDSAAVLAECKRSAAEMASAAKF